MGKIKIHELAKNIGIGNKELLEIAKKLGISAKSHLSAITDEEAKELEKAAKNQSQKQEKPEKVEKNEKIEKQDKSNPVIIRRAVIISDDEEAKKQEEKKRERDRNSNIGFVENRRNTDYNIVYRNKPTKPKTVSELFGFNKPEKNVKKVEEEKEQTMKQEEIKEKTETKEEIVVTKQEETVKSENLEKQEAPKVQDAPKPLNNNYNNKFNNQNRDQRNNTYNHNNNQNNNFNRPNNNYNNQQRNNNINRNNNGYNNQNRDRQNNNNFGRPNNNYNNQRPGMNNNRPQRPLDDKGIDKNIKNIMAMDIPEKENVRDYENKVRDKQKINRQEDQKPKKNKKNNNSNIDSDKLKSLKQTDKLSHMFREEGEMLDYYDLSTERGRRSKKKLPKTQERTKQKIFKLTEITIPEKITVKDLAAEMKITSSEVIKKLLGYGIMATINNEIDFDTAFLIAGEFDINAIKKDVKTDEDILFDDSEDKPEDLTPRAPVVVVMGHVDHGKTSLLDAIRSTNVIEGESGGITQHIGAYKVEVNGRPITFLDTPGHEAFTSMRARGAQITDIAILVVAANDGIMPQTVEAINHAKAANVPIIVAVNKMDLEGANMEKIKQDMTEYDLVAEEWGGQTIFVPISAKTKMNIDTLLEMVLLQADILELKSNPKKQAKGTIIEAKLDKTRGPVATMLVQRGTLDVGDTIVVGSTIGRIRTMKNDKGQNVKNAGPSTPVEITGLTTVPQSGDTFYEVEDEKTAKHLIEKRKREERDKHLKSTSKVTLEDLFNKIESENLKELNLIVKADVQGSVEALKQSLEKLSTKDIRVKVIHANVGGVTESDVTLAKVSNAIIIAFNVRPEPMAKAIAEKESIDIKTYSVIYNAIEDVEAAMKGMRDPEFKEVIIGNIEVRQTFKVSNVGTIAGGYVLNGKVVRHAKVRVIRENVVIFEGEIASLKRFKDDVKEVASGYECGIQIEGYNDIKEGDIIEAHIMEEVKQ